MQGLGVSFDTLSSAIERAAGNEVDVLGNNANGTTLNGNSAKQEWASFFSTYFPNRAKQLSCDKWLKEAQKKAEIMKKAGILK